MSDPRDPCVNCGGDGFLYDDRGVPSICGSCGGSGVSRFCPVETRCDHPGPRCVDCARMGCIQRCRPFRGLVQPKPRPGDIVEGDDGALFRVDQDAHAIHGKEKK